jgi:hypothetical protein
VLCLFLPLKGYTLDKHNAKVELFLDLLHAGLKRAYFAVMDTSDKDNKPIQRMEIFLQNVGSLCLYQSFEEQDDIQIPKIKVFYSLANEPNAQTEIENIELKLRAIHIVYNTKKYFEQKPEHTIIDEQDLIKKVRHNEQMAKKNYARYMNRIAYFWKSLYKEK